MKEDRCKSIVMAETFCLICSKLPVRKMLQYRQIAWFQSLTVLVLRSIFQIWSLFSSLQIKITFFLSFHNWVQKTIDDHLLHNNLQCQIIFPSLLFSRLNKYNSFKMCLTNLAFQKAFHLCTLLWIHLYLDIKIIFLFQILF